jgi:hypothetical protein
MAELATIFMKGEGKKKNKVAASSLRVMYLLALLCTEIGGNLFSSFLPTRSRFPWPLRLCAGVESLKQVGRNLSCVTMQTMGDDS